MPGRAQILRPVRPAGQRCSACLAESGCCKTLHTVPRGPGTHAHVPARDMEVCRYMGLCSVLQLDSVLFSHAHTHTRTHTHSHTHTCTLTHILSHARTLIHVSQIDLNFSCLPVPCYIDVNPTTIYGKPTM